MRINLWTSLLYSCMLSWRQSNYSAAILIADVVSFPLNAITRTSFLEQTSNALVALAGPATSRCATTHINGSSMSSDNDDEDILRSSFLLSQNEQHPTGASGTIISLPLKFLPNGGCWAVRTTIWNRSRSSSFSYYAVLDTGSPFLMVPSIVFTQDKKFNQRSTNDRLLMPWKSGSPGVRPTSTEQYGSTQGTMDWYQVSSVTLSGWSADPVQNAVVGVASDEMATQAGGTFLGLMPKHDTRPTFMQQAFPEENAVSQFRIEFGDDSPDHASWIRENCRLQISTAPSYCRWIRPEVDDPSSLLPLYDLSKFGPDLYHYAVECTDTIDLRWGHGISETVDVLNLSRPVVVVLDTGLTGIIFSDTLTNEILGKRKPSDPSSGIENIDAFADGLLGVKIRMKTMGTKAFELRSGADRQYWDFSSFHLPWFADDGHDASKYNADYPHVIAIGSTFWVQTAALSIDISARVAKIEKLSA